jgi:hypothetical protein
VGRLPRVGFRSAWQTFGFSYAENRAPNTIDGDAFTGANWQCARWRDGRDHAHNASPEDQRYIERLTGRVLHGALAGTLPGDCFLPS